ncbi:uncharacterized protein PG986_014335 [Apiospora aurea]|uniref:Caleosin n=1 Tax=Apiospora aurea TaxID=335848 RepID=A0ABR1PSZ7_9PEZI
MSGKDSGGAGAGAGAGAVVGAAVVGAAVAWPADTCYETCLKSSFLFRVYLRNIHKDKHGSDSGIYDHEGRFSPQHFHSTFVKYAEGRDYLTAWDIWKMLKGQRVIMDPIGWFGAFFEWFATYLMLWPEDGKIWKEDMRRVYDGSIFHIMAQRRAQKSKAT